MFSCRYSNTDSTIETVELLLDRGANVNLKNSDGLTALMLACRNSNTDSNIETVKLLLNVNNIDVNIVFNDTKYNVLILLYKYKQNQHEISKLLKSKTNLSHRNFQNKKIEDIYLDEYKYLFSNTLEDFYRNMK